MEWTARQGRVSDTAAGTAGTGPRARHRHNDDGKRCRQGTSRGCGGWAGRGGGRVQAGPGAAGNTGGGRAGSVAHGRLRYPRATGALAPPQVQQFLRKQPPHCLHQSWLWGQVCPDGGGAGGGLAAWRAGQCGKNAPRATVWCVHNSCRRHMRRSESHCVCVYVRCACRWKEAGPTMAPVGRWRQWAQLAVESDRGFFGA